LAGRDEERGRSEVAGLCIGEIVGNSLIKEINGGIVEAWMAYSPIYTDFLILVERQQAEAESEPLQRVDCRYAFIAYYPGNPAC
jgi:hypothetical protein